MKFLSYEQITWVLQTSVVIFFGIGLLSLLFLGIRIRYFQKSLNKWMKENRRLSKDPVLDHIIRTCKYYNEKGQGEINTEAVIKSNYYKQKIFLIPIYYWEQLISKSEILSLFLGLLGTFILVHGEIDDAFYPLILSTGAFIVLVLLETVFSLQEKRRILFTQLEEYLDNSYLPSLNKTPVASEILKEEKIEPLYIYDKIPAQKETKDGEGNELKDKEIEWIIKQFYGEEKKSINL
ncbi:hypothetical protein [Defluviitalea saccharophila]|uniref:Uncharacterized protein n=1 Tax=Defluviitalea saccharophila TaxID=879970 RepID=A0ABZ2Y1D8_9FIRM